MIKRGVCGTNMYKHVTAKKRKDGSVRRHARLRCSSYTKEPYGAPTYDPDEMYGALAGTALDQLGGFEVVHRAYARGAENLARATELQASIKHYMDGLAPGSSFAVGAQETLQKLGAELGSIAPESTKDRWIYKPLGLTYSQHWSQLGADQMEKELLRAGITFVVHQEQCDLLIPDDVKSRLIVKDDYFKKKL